MRLLATSHNSNYNQIGTFPTFVTTLPKLTALTFVQNGSGFTGKVITSIHMQVRVDLELVSVAADRALDVDKLGLKYTNKEGNIEIGRRV